jgi:two-component system, OmpR family, response regulator MprA
MKVLVVDVEPALRGALERALLLEGHAIAGDGDEPDAIVLVRRVEPGGEVLAYADLRMSLTAHEVTRGGRTIELTRTEFALLRLFLEHPEQVLSRSQIFERVWGYDFGATSNTLGVYMGYLRRKVERPGEPPLLRTVRGVGYVLRHG